MKIDRRKNYYLTIDTETCNTSNEIGFDNPIVYDIGGCIHDKKGNVYETFSYIVYETFCGMKDLMQSAYYAKKIPSYEEEIAKGQRTIARYFTIRQKVHELCKKYNVKAIIAHNARFDYRATTCTQRYLTKSKYRWFLPYNIPIWDTLKMAQDTICKQKGYKTWCKSNGYLTRSKQVKATAEILYRYISGDNNFIEEHKGLEDVLIEKEIFAHCIRQHKPMRKECFA